MKRFCFLLTGTIAIVILLSSCSPVTLSGWMNPKATEKTVHKVVVWTMFDKVEYRQPFEQAFYQYFTDKGLTCIPAYGFITPDAKYDYKVLEAKFDSLGADAILIVSYRNTDKKDDYVAPVTMAYPDYYYNYYRFYSWGYPMYGPGYNMARTGGYWTTTTVVNLTANLYGNSKDDLIWSGEISITDPQYIDEASAQIARSVLADWKSKGLVNLKK
ncbi:MAG TPA: hypothetical protein VLR52_03675 [Bacteroidales bacterium]|nr:hypothetical protein [Bacteroidales bacterium]